MRKAVAVIFFSILTLFIPVLAEAQPIPVGGTVAEVIEAGNYTYLRLDDPKIWIATTPLQISSGDRVEYAGGMEMRNFHSKALDRSFESIWFIQNVNVTARDLEQLHQEVNDSSAAGNSSIALPDVAATPGAGEIEKFEGGKTIAEITADPDALNETKVSLRAKVIKVSSNIMGKNWITLQDGTGSVPNDKLIATSKENVTAGDVVTAHGKVRTDVDLGSGYLYDVLLEETTFSP
jgi:hypothetical protein